MKKNQDLPSKFFLRFFRWFCHPDLLASIEGDLMELYNERVKKLGRRRANLKFVVDVLLLLRPGIIAPIEGYKNVNNYGMLKNYLKIGFRNLLRQRMYSAIKVGGFAIGIAACLLITLFIRDELSYDQFYDNADQLYRVVNINKDNGEVNKMVWFQAPFANAIKEDFPEIEAAGRFNSGAIHGAGSGQIRLIEKTESNYEEGFVYFDQELLSLLNLPMVFGDPDHALDNPHALVITRRKAEKYFPKVNPVGQQVVLSMDSEPYTISGVIEDFPVNSHLQFDFLITLKGIEFWPGEQSNWGSYNYPTYVRLRPGVNPNELENKMQSVVERYLLPMWIEDARTDVKELAKNVSFELQPIGDIYLYSEGILDPVQHGDIRFIWLFGGVAAFILIIACINFVNLSTAKSANRAKEVGLRKAIGSNRSNIVAQFLTESLLYSLLSFVLAIGLAWTMLPYFNVLASKSIAFPWNEWSLLPILIGASLVVGLLSGLYPSFYLSSFEPIQVLKGKLSRGSKNAATRNYLVVFQFTTSIILIIATIVIYQQVDFILNKKLGFEKDNVILIHGANSLGNNTKNFKEELLQLSQVKNASIGDYLPIKGTKRNGNLFWNEGKRSIDKEVAGQIWEVDHDYIQTMEMNILEGRDFSKAMSTDSLSVIINQAMARELGLSDPLGKRITNGRIYNVIGVVEDFNYESLRGKIEPLCFVLGEKASIISVKVNSTEVVGTLKSITSLWKKFSPSQSIRYSFLDESYARMYDDVQKMGRIFTAFAVLAIMVASLGLFALSAFMVEQRGKEISIRLVLGATLYSVFSMLAFSFIRLVLVSIVIAIPIAWYSMQRWLEDFTYKTDITLGVFVTASLLAIFIALSTISYQSIRAALMNPVDSLKSE